MGSKLELLCFLGVDLLRRPLLGKQTTLMFSTCESRAKDFTLFGNGVITFPRMMGTNDCLSEIIVGFLCHYVNTHIIAPDHQTVKASAFTASLTTVFVEVLMIKSSGFD